MGQIVLIILDVLLDLEPFSYQLQWLGENHEADPQAKMKQNFGI